MIHKGITCKSIALLAFAAVAGPAGAQQQADLRTGQFLKTAIEGNIAEIQIGTLAEQRASGEARRLANMIVNDHKNALEEATSIAEDLGVEVPEKPSAKAQGECQKLAQQSGSAFDRQFIDLMVKNHQSTIEKYRSYAESAEDGSEVAEYANKTLPTLEKHLREAQSLDTAGG